MFSCASPHLQYSIQDMENGEKKDDGVNLVNGHHEGEEQSTEGRRHEAELPNGINPTLRSEDSGLGISASPSEQHLSPAAEGKGISKEGEGMWRRGGSVDTMTQSLQDILAFITTR